MKKSILFIHPFLCYPMTSGGHQALFNGIKAVKDDFDITLAFEGTADSATEQNIDEFRRSFPNILLRPLLTIRKKESVARRIYHSLVQFFRKKGGNKDGIESYWKWSVSPSSREWVEHIYKVSREKKYDIIVIEMPWIIKDIFAMPSGPKIIHVHHELGFVRRDLEIKEVGESPFLLSCKKFADFNEIGQLNMYDAVITLSPTDTKKLIENGVSVPVYSSFATIDSVSAPEECKGSGMRLTFVGFGGHSPNAIGLKWFLENCWLELKGRDSDYCLDIIGKWDEAVINDYTTRYQDIHFLGFVEDLFSALKDSVMIVPITIGSGIRIKILEACGKGVPFVSTSIGAEGIPVVDGHDCLIADTPDQFVRSILELQDVNLRNKFVQNAHKMITEHYSIDALRENRVAIIEDVMQSN